MSGSCREALLDVRSGWEALPDVRELSGDPPGCAGGSPRFLRVVERPSWMTKNGLETIPDVREVHPDVREVIPEVREWSGGPPGCPGVVEELPRYLGVVRKPPGCPVVVVRPTRMSGSGREAFQYVWEW